MKINFSEIPEAWLSDKKKNGVIQCGACNHECKIPKGKTGICGVRYNDAGTLRLLVYGRPIAAHVDPIEKKPLFHFYPGSDIFSIGTVGCNFRCKFCQNWDISQYPSEHQLQEIINSGTPMPPEVIVEYCVQEKIPAIAFTYNEPAIFFEYAYDTAKLAKKKGIHTVYVSNGFETKKALDKILPYLDAINIDLKSFRDEFYREICGARIEPVKENIRYLWEKGMWVEVTTLIVTNHNDSEKELSDIAKFLADISPDLPWHISRYFPCYKMSDPSTPSETLQKAYDIGKKAGLKYVYVGNISGFGKEDTHCPKCDELLVSRLGYSVENFMKGGKCPKCSTKVVGQWG